MCHVSACAGVPSSSWVSLSRVLGSVYSPLEIIDKSRGGKIRRGKSGAEAVELPVERVGGKSSWMDKFRL